MAKDMIKSAPTKSVMPISTEKTESTDFSICGIFGSENIPAAAEDIIITTRQQSSSAITGSKKETITIAAKMPTEFLSRDTEPITVVNASLSPVPTTGTNEPTINLAVFTPSESEAAARVVCIDKIPVKTVKISPKAHIAIFLRAEEIPLSFISGETPDDTPRHKYPLISGTIRKAQS